MENRDMADKLSQALEEVPEEMRSLLMMYAVNGMSYFEIAQASGLPPGTVKSRISRGRQIVMETLKKFRTRKQLSRLTNRGR
jgi:RNA polymerase sigma-70 factor (ECF subfamily)